MPRATLDVALSTRTARERLQPRHGCYWRGLGAGAGIGYRKSEHGGSWVVRIVDSTAGGGYRQHALGSADDTLKADGTRVLDYRQAEGAARDWIARWNRIAAGLETETAPTPAVPCTVQTAVADYMADYIERGGKGLSQTRAAVDAHILPKLGAHLVAKLTREHIRTWHRELAASPARVRGKPGATADTTDPERVRRRRSTANRILTILKAALNHARHEGRITVSGEAWAAVKPFREADKAKVRYLQDDEIMRLVNACPGDFKALVTAALLTGCRYGELAALLVSDFDPQAPAVHIGRSKSGRPRNVFLTEEGASFFGRMTLGREGGACLFERDVLVRQATRSASAQTARAAWGKSDQFRQMRAGCAAARIDPAVSFHDLRHTYASRLAAGEASMRVIADQLGHSDTRMTERHYAHLAPSYVKDTVRRSFGKLGLVPVASVVPLRHRSTS